MSLVLKSNTKFTGDINTLPVVADMAYINNLTSIVGTRKLRSDYDGALLRVSRTDGEEKDIMPLGNGSLDTATLLNFVGSGDGTVAIFYDQSGNGRYFSRADKTRQPFIVKAGVLQRASNNQPCVLWNEPVKSLFMAAKPSGAVVFAGVYIEASFRDVAYGILGDRDNTNDIISMQSTSGSNAIKYNIDGTSALKSLAMSATSGELSRFYTEVDSTDKKVSAKDANGEYSADITGYVPIPSVREIIIGSAGAGGLMASNMKGYITAFAISINNKEAGTGLKNLVF